MNPLAATVSPTAYWYLARATGAVSLVLLTISVVLGIFGPLRVGGSPRWPRFALITLHRDVSLAVIALLVAHIATSVLDGFAPIAWLDGLLPFNSPYRPLWLGLGTLSFDLLLALVLTSLIRRRLGYGAWRAVHWVAYAAWTVAVLHGLGTGSDIKQAWLLALTAACLVAVLAAVLARLRRTEVPDGARWGLGSLAVAVPVGMLAFTAVGPLGTGWARRAGTPAPLLAFHRRPAPRVVPVPAVAQVQRPFRAQLVGSLSRRAAATGSVIQITLRMTGEVPGILRIRLAGAADGTGGLRLSGSQVDLAGAGMPVALSGRVTSLQGQTLSARVAGPGQAPVDLHVALAINGLQVNGTLEGVPAGASG